MSVICTVNVPDLCNQATNQFKQTSKLDQPKGPDSWMFNKSYRKLIYSLWCGKEIMMNSEIKLNWHLLDQKN